MAGNLKKGGGAAAALIALLVLIVGPFEGLRLFAYRDTNGIATVCYGETKGVKITDRHTKEECDEIFGHSLRDYAQHVEQCISREMSIKTEAAFVSLAYNIGWQGFCRSRVAALYNAGELEAACEAMTAFVRDLRGVVLPGLVRRRGVERKLCLEGLAG